MIRHFIFTNFGIGIADPLWILYRLELFERTVYRSLTAQTNKDFTWIIFLDENIDFVFRSRIEGLVARAQCCVELVFVTQYSLVKNEISRIVRERVSQSDVLITTRIDDDDLILDSAVSKIQDCSFALEGEYVLCSFKRGFEFLAAEGVIREIDCETIALGLTLISPPNKERVWVTNYAHHLIKETLEKNGVDVVHKYLCGDSPSWFYTKHSISDSVYFGARARILSDPGRQKVDENNTKGFGASWADFQYIINLTSDAPFGMPHKYMERFSSAFRGNEWVVDFYSRYATRENPSKKVRQGKKVRVAILGSCVTRDLFEFEPQLRSKFDVVFYSARSSVISYCSAPIFDRKIYIPGEGFEDIRGRYDLEKSHWKRLRESLPDVIIFDFIDERIGLIEHNGSFFSASGPVMKAFERAGVGVSVIRPWDEKLVDLRLWALGVFLERLRDVCSNLVLHKARWCSRYIDTDGVKSFSDTKWSKLIELNSIILDNLYSEVGSHWVPCDSIELGENVTLAGGNHKWDLSPFHYDGAYYRQFAKLLLNRMSLDK